MQAKIVVVDDDSDLCELLETHLGSLDWAVITCVDSHHAVETVLNEQPALVILDVMMPGIDGISLCRMIRERSSVPIVFLSSRNGTFDRIIGLRAGADDYIGKPFDLDELEERIRAILRRTKLGAPTYGADRVLEYGGLRFDMSRRSITYKGSFVSLSPMEAGLLEKLARSPRRMLSRDELSRDVWHHDGDQASRTIDVHVQRLRKKLQMVGGLGNWIVTIKSGGYEFAPLDDAVR
jgi:DNA-binding response OmpR family regulator